MALPPATKERIERCVSENDVVLFMKGTRDAPQCGFSAQVIGHLDRVLESYETVDVLAEPDVREGIKEWSSWPTIPQLYVKGELVGGCDIVLELVANGEWHQALGIPEPAAAEAPGIEVSPEAIDAIGAIRRHMKVPDELDVRVEVDARNRCRLDFSDADPRDVVTTIEGVTFRFDPDSALRANGLRLGVRDTDRGRELSVELPD